MSNLTFNLKTPFGRRTWQVRRNGVGIVLALPLIALFIVLLPVMLVFGLVTAVVALLKPVFLLAGVVVAGIGIFNLVTTGHGWLTLLIGAGIFLFARSAKITVNR